MSQKLTLSVSVSHRPGNTAKVKVVSNVLVRVNDRAVAFKTLGGKYTAEQALREFKRVQGKGWEAQPGTDPTHLAFYAKAA